MIRYIFCAVLWLGAGAGMSQDAPEPSKVSPEDQAAHDELIALRERIVKAYQARDVDGVLAELSDDIVVTWQNAEVSRRHEGIRNFYKVMMEGANSVVVDLKSSLKVDELSRLDLDRKMAVAVGSLEDDFTLRDGKQFHLSSRWTATLVKKDSDWKITAFHVSTNMMDNGVLRLTVEKNRLYIGGIAGAVGIILGGIAGWAFRRPKAAK